MIMGLFSCDITQMRVPWVRLVGPLRRTLVPLLGVNARRLAIIREIAMVSEVYMDSPYLVT
jgi:hypothetical protein